MIQERVAQQGAAFVLLDLPVELFQSVVAVFHKQPVLFFNARHRQDILRERSCSGLLLHTIASNAMLNDALAQFLKSRNWNRVLILQGPETSDEEQVKAFTHSAKKFKLKIVGKKPFVLSNNPRDRARTNIPLLTSSPKHEVLFIADSFGEFARYVPYHTYAPSLVVGSEGLIPAAWHWTWERHGAPQLNQRFSRSVSRSLKKRKVSASATVTRMSSPEWAGWVAVKSLVASVTGSKSTEFDAIADYLLSDRLTLDMYKGTSGSFRPWNGQLRQPVLLHTHNAVVDRAPIDGFMHRINNLDTLGLDRQESGCVE